MIVIFPFEQEFYRKHGVEVFYVGHPLAHADVPAIPRDEFATRFLLDPAKEWIGLLPGSRRKEVRLNLPPMLQAAKLLRDQGSNYEYVLPVASTLDAAWVCEQIAASPVKIDITLTDNSRVTLKHCRAAVVASGTATVEAALAGTPFVVVYRVARLTWLLGRRLVRLDTFAMPNLIAGRRIVPELIQQNFTAENILHELAGIIAEGPKRQQMLADLKDVQDRLRDPGDGQPPAVRAAREITGSLARAKPKT